jgi:hypothetical protein
MKSFIVRLLAGCLLACGPLAFPSPAQDAAKDAFSKIQLELSPPDQVTLGRNI